MVQKHIPNTPDPLQPQRFRSISQTPQIPSNHNSSEAYPKHPRPPPTTMVQNPHKAISSYVNHHHTYYQGETACPVFRAMSLKILFFWEVTHVTESTVGPENEETTILQQLLPHTQQPYITTQKN
jgi:hypothetical protein